MIHEYDDGTASGVDFCVLPGNDCEGTKNSANGLVSMQSLAKIARRFHRKNIRGRVRPMDEARSGPFRSNNNIPMGHRIY